MLVGREAECERIERMLDGTRRACGGALVVRGEAGIGKSALLRHAQDRATNEVVLTAVGVRSEAELPFAGLLQIVRPVSAFIEALSGPQRSALRTALALDPPSPAMDRFAVGAGLLALLATVAERGPVLVVVDDAQWLDAASLEAALFAARRLTDDPVSFLFAVRTDRDDHVELDGLECMELEELGRQDTAELAARFLAAPPTPELADRIFAITRGNPLAIVELRDLSVLQLALGQPIPVSRAVEHAYAQRTAQLSRSARQALLVLAADDSLDGAATKQALVAFGLDASILEEAERAGLLTTDARGVRFKHPLVRSAVFQTAPAHERRLVHQTLAATLTGVDVAARRVFHLAQAAAAPDETLAASLEAIGEDALARRAYAAAGVALARAATLSVASPASATRALAAAGAHWKAGNSRRALDLLDSALAACDSPLVRADIQSLRGRIDSYGGDHAGDDLLVREARLVAPLDPQRAAQMFSHAFHAALRRASIGLALETIDEARRTPGVIDDDIEALGQAFCLSGRYRLAVPLLRRSADARAHDDPNELTHRARELSWLGEYREANCVAQRALELTRHHYMPSAVPAAALHLCNSAAALGDFAAASAAGDEAVRIGTATGQRILASFAAWALATFAAMRGRRQECERHLADAARLNPRFGFASVHDGHSATRGLLELVAGDARLAARLIADSIDLDNEQTDTAPSCPSGFDLVEAYTVAGQPRAAQATLNRLADRAHMPWAAAALGRARGLLATANDGDALFQDSIALSAALGTTIEEARARLLYGEWLRRHKRRIDAREQLRHALATFERAATNPWADRARAELIATGETLTARQTTNPVDALTPQELRVCQLVARGASNREAASHLFLSVKTIEAHLHRAYRKLDIDSRDKLRTALEPQETLRHTEAGTTTRSTAPDNTSPHTPWAADLQTAEPRAVP